MEIYETRHWQITNSLQQFFSDISHNTIDGVDFRHSTQSQTYN